jgi:uncharacterized membrane protein YhaH (DUF805 family)
MQFGEAIQTCFTKYFVFRGRATRSEYWYFVLFCFLVRIASAIGDLVVFGFGIYPRIGFEILTGLLLVIPQFAVLVRRFHDTEHSGLLVLGLIALAFVDGLIFRRYSVSDGPILMSIGLDAIVLVTAILFIIQFVWLVSPGTEGDNKFGSDPLKPRNKPA